MSRQPVGHLHAVVDFAHRLHSRLDSLVGVPLMSMTPSKKREVLVELTRGVARAEMLRLRFLAEAEQSEATVDSGAASAADWLATETRQVRRDAAAVGRGRPSAESRCWWRQSPMRFDTLRPAEQ